MVVYLFPRAYALRTKIHRSYGTEKPKLYSPFTSNPRLTPCATIVTVPTELNYPNSI